MTGFNAVFVKYESEGGCRKRPIGNASSLFSALRSAVVRIFVKVHAVREVLFQERPYEIKGSADGVDHVASAGGQGVDDPPVFFFDGIGGNAGHIQDVHVVKTAAEGDFIAVFLLQFRQIPVAGLKGVDGVHADFHQNRQDRLDVAAAVVLVDHAGFVAGFHHKGQLRLDELPP